MAMNGCCLRPEFTHQLIELLQQGKNINLISPHGQGRRRTLQDLRSTLAKSWRVFQVDMRDIEKHGLTILDVLLKQANIEKLPDIQEFTLKMNKTSIYHLIIIHNYQFLTDLNVISSLNEIEQYPYVSLLCVSEEKEQCSTLIAEDCILPAVTSQQLLVEIDRRDLALNENDMTLLVDFLLHQATPYSSLDAKPASWFTDGLWKSEI